MSTSVAERRSAIHGMWAAVAQQWALHAEETDRRVAPITAAIWAGTPVRAGDRVLELACGAGGLGLEAARRVGSAGKVVVSDVVPEMVAAANHRAVMAALANVETRTLDLESIEEPDGRYDVVLCREGLMFAVQPQQAVAELRRVLRPGGRVGLSVWGPRADNPWLGLVLDAVSAQLGHPVPPPHVPHPFALGDRDQLAALLSHAGFVAVQVSPCPVPLLAPSFEAWWQRTTAIAGPIVTVLARLPEHTRQAIVEDLRARVAPYTTPAGLDLPGLALVATARAPQTHEPGTS